jgi:hypothetical protein
VKVRGGGRKKTSLCSGCQAGRTKGLRVRPCCSEDKR